MNRLFRNILIFILRLISVYILLLLLLVCSTFFTHHIEKSFSLSNWEIGHNMKRTRDLEVWSSNQSAQNKLLIIGSSTGMVNINREILDSSLNVSSFNASSPGMPTGIAFYILKGVLKKFKPDHIVLDLNPIVWDKYRSRTTNDWIINNSYPYQTYILELCFKRGWVNQYNLYAYRLIKYLVPFAKYHYLKGDGAKQTYLGDGYVGLENIEFEKRYNSEIFWSKDNLIHLDKINSLCEKNDIPLTLLIPSTVSLKYDLKEIEKYNHITLNMNKYSYPQEYYNDEVHFNSEAAKYFTKDLVSELELIINFGNNASPTPK